MGTGALDELVSLVPDALLIGEHRHRSLAQACQAFLERQTEAFQTIVKVAAASGGKVLSIHSVKSVDLVFDILEETGCTPAAAGSIPILY
jgi:Tat protein secretion system quality control protein TatD with DNase activity